MFQLMFQFFWRKSLKSKECSICGNVPAKNHERPKKSKRIVRNILLYIYEINKSLLYRGCWLSRTFRNFWALIVFARNIATIGTFLRNQALSLEQYKNFLEHCAIFGTLGGFSGVFRGCCTMRLEEVAFVFLMCFLLGYLIGGLG